MSGTNDWNEYEAYAQPKVVGSTNFLPHYNVWSSGLLRWSIVNRNVNTYVGWIPCYDDGRPITYADNNNPGTIIVSCSGSYITQ